MPKKKKKRSTVKFVFTGKFHPIKYKTKESKHEYGV